MTPVLATHQDAATTSSSTRFQNHHLLDGSVLLIQMIYDLRWVSVWGRGLRWTPWAIFWLPMARTSAKSSTSRSFCQHAWWRRNAQVDIEGAELVTLPQWIESGILERVDQLGIELHLAEIHQARKMMVLNINRSTGYAPTCVRVEKIKNWMKYKGWVKNKNSGVLLRIFATDSMIK